MPIIIIPPRTNPSGSGGGSGGVSVHNDLTGIQGGIVGSYYHSNQSLNTTDNVAFNRLSIGNSERIYNSTDPSKYTDLLTNVSGDLIILPISNIVNLDNQKTIMGNNAAVGNNEEILKINQDYTSAQTWTNYNAKANSTNITWTDDEPGSAITAMNAGLVATPSSPTTMGALNTAFFNLEINAPSTIGAIRAIYTNNTIASNSTITRSSVVDATNITMEAPQIATDRVYDATSSFMQSGGRIIDNVLFDGNFYDWGEAGTSHLDNLYAFRFNTMPAFTGYTIDKMYGLYLAPIARGTTTNYAIYSLGGDSYHAGKIGIGSTTPSTNLDVVGTGKFSSTLQIGAYTLPSANGTAGQTLVNNGSGVVSWGSGISTFSTYGTTGSVLFIGSGNSIGEDNAYFNYDYTKHTLQLNDTLNNTKIGYQSLYNNVSGQNNTALGYQSLYSRTNTSPSNSVAVGQYAGYEGTNRSVIVGTQGAKNVSGHDNTALGYNALYGTLVSTSNAAYFTQATTSTLQSTNNGLNAGAGNATYVCWAKFDLTGAGAEYIMSGTETDFGRKDILLTRNTMGGTIVSAQIGYGQVNSAAVVTNGQWHFIAVTRNSSTLKINIKINNGAAVEAAYTMDTVYGAPYSFILGNRTGQLFFNGSIASAGMWKRVLSDDELTTLYNSGNGVIYSNLSTTMKVSLTSFWNLNETTGNRVDSQSGYNLTPGATMSYSSGIPGAAVFTLSDINHNIAIGASSLFATFTGNSNIAIGNLSGYGNTSGSGNIFIGNYTGYGLTTGIDNVYIGDTSGYLATGSSNVFLGHNAGYYETGSSKLYIANSNTRTPLIYGDFSTGRIGIGSSIPLTNLDVNGTGRFIGTLTVGSYYLPTTSGTVGQTLVNNGSGVVGWQTNFVINMQSRTWEKSTGTWAYGFDTGGSYLYNSTAANADSAGSNIYIPSGTYTFTLMTGTGDNRAIYALVIDDTEIATQDMYAAVAAQTTWSVGLTTYTTIAGNHKILLKAKGKHASSSAYVVVINNAWIK